MKKVYIKLAKILGILAIALFAGVFIWANWTPLTLGEKTEPVAFSSYDISDLHDNSKIASICATLRSVEGSGTVTNSPATKTIILIFYPYRVDEKTIMDEVKAENGYQLKWVKTDPNKKRCPMMGSLSFFSKVRRALNIRG